MKKAMFFLVVFHSVITSIGQVNHQTGSAVFSLPMFSWQDDKSRLSSVVALNYNSGNGLRVDEVASNVGQGWNLVAGGVISRMTVGEPDDQQANEGNGSDQDISKYPAGYWYAPVPAFNGCPGALSKYPIYKAMNQQYTLHNRTVEDRQLDYFSFQFNGKSGMFVLDTLADGTMVGVPLGDTRLTISLKRDPNLRIQKGIRTTITSFSIQDVDGLIYKFSTHGVTQVLHEDYCDANITQPLTQPKFKDNQVYHQAGFANALLTSPQVIGSWYLDTIADPLTQRKIYFTYYLRSVNSKAGEGISYNQSGNYSIISHKTSITTTPEIKSITYPDGHLVSFGYAGITRADFNGEYALSTVDMSYQGRPLSEYQLNTTYFILNRYGTPTTSYQNSVARLCLRSVKKIGVDLKEDTPPYIFDYNLGSDAVDDFVPPPFFYAKDIWGYFNGNNSVGFDGAAIPMNTTASQLSNNQLKGLCFLHMGVTGVYLNPKTGYAKNGLLKQIIYPTGGTLSYQYAQDTGVLGTSTTAVGGVHVTQTSSTDGGYSNGCANPIVTLYNYVMNGAGSASSLWGLELPVNSMTTSSHYQSEDKRYHWKWSCAPFGCCYWNFQYPGILSQNEAISLSDFQNFMSAIGPVLGILTIVSDVADALELIFVSSGFFAWVAVIIDVIAGLLTTGLTCLGSDNSRDNSNVVYYNTNLNDVSPLPTQFKRVEIVENPGTIGKTVEEFTSSDDYAIWVPAGANPDFSAKQRFAPWAYGLPKLTTVYGVSGNMVKQTQNVYDTSHAVEEIDYYFGKNPNGGLPGTINPSGLRTPLVSCKCEVLTQSSQRNTSWADQTVYDDPASYLTASGSGINVDYYAIYTGRVMLSSTHERIFKTNDATQMVETVTSYTYNTYNYEVSSITTNQSNGDVNTKSITYTCDYANNHNAGLNTLIQNNIVTLPVSSYTTVYSTVTNTSSLLNEKVTEFVQLANGDIKPGRILEQRFAQPTATSTYSPDNVNNNTIYKQTHILTYDANGNMIGVQDEGGRTISNIYDYNDKYVVASLINAAPVVDKPAYTSFETAGLGGWSLTGSLTYASNAITGSRSFALASNTLSAPLNTARPYTVSFWSTAAITVAGGATLTKSAPVINGFTYYEYDIAQGTTAVSLSGNATIDELRLYPKTARMHTTTYDPLIGKTSECDENGMVTYYEYDNLGRLKFVKDENHSALKMYEYNTVSPAKQNGCPGTYSSHLAQETFTRSNCAAGYKGTDVTFTVPAAKYSSALSQQDADIKAELDLLTNGPAFAITNGSCLLIYHNAALSRTDSTQTCDEGYYGGFVTYTVPAGRYSSTVSQADADQMAINDTLANAQAYANSPAHALCIITTDTVWNSLEGAATMCQNVNGVGHEFILVTNVNPRSATYGQTKWLDIGPQDACPTATYYNVARSQVFTRACGAGYLASSVTYTVPAARYSSTLSQADADQMAINDINANGQNYANTNGTCTLIPVVYVQLTIENSYTAPDGGTIGDVVFRFYSDAACTHPTPVSNLNVYYSQFIACLGGTTTTYMTVSGTYYVLRQSIEYDYPSPPGCDPAINCSYCIIDFSLSPGAGYIIK